MLSTFLKINIPESGVAGVLGVLGLVTCDKGVEAAEFDPPTFDKVMVTWGLLLLLLVVAFMSLFLSLKIFLNNISKKIGKNVKYVQRKVFKNNGSIKSFICKNPKLAKNLITYFSRCWATKETKVLQYFDNEAQFSSTRYFYGCYESDELYLTVRCQIYLIVSKCHMLDMSLWF